MFSFLRNQEIHAFFISNAFIRNDRLKLVKHQGKTKEHREAELLQLESYSHPEAEHLLVDIIHLLHPRYHPKIIDILKKLLKTSTSV